MKKMLKDSEQIAISEKPKRQQLYKLYKLILNRVMFKYGPFHSFEEYLRCICYKSKKSLKSKMKSKAGMRHFYFKKAHARLNHDLDIAGLL